jgi:signal transduction histidine kinase
VAAAIVADAPLHITNAQMLQQDGGSFDPPPAQVQPEGPAGTWTQVELPHVALQRGKPPGPSEVVTTWYRIQLGSAFAGQPPQAIHLYLPRWQTIGQVAVFGDGRLLFNSHGGPVWNGFNHPLWVPLAGTQGSVLPRTLLIRLSSATAAGGAISSAWVGPQDALMWRYRVREWLQADVPWISSGAFLALGLFSLAVWGVRRKESIYGLFFASSVLFYIRCLHYHWGLQPIPVPEAWFGWATVNSLGWFLLTVYLFGFRLHGRAYPWLERGFIALTLLTTIVMLPPLEAGPLAALNAPAYLGMLVASIALICTGVWAAWRARARGALVLALFNLCVLPLGVHDLMLQTYQVSMESVYLVPYAGIGNFLIFLALIARRYIGALGVAAHAQARLELRLRERESELAASYERLRVAEYERTLSQERRRLMQDMHDGLGSSLTSALRMVEHGHIGEADVAQVLKECIDDLKLTIDSLEPVETDLLLLLATLRFRLEPRLENTGLKLHWEVSEVLSLDWLDPRGALHILRMLQETFTNVIKHAQATEIRVSTDSDAEGVIVRISDNGRGLPDDAHARGGKGLANLRRRAQAIGARLHWVALERGTCFELWLPVQAPAERPS